MEFQAMLIVILLVILVGLGKSDNVVFNLQRSYGLTGRSALRQIEAQDSLWRGRILAAADFELGGNGRPRQIPIYYTRLEIGTPPKVYHVQVDTGSETLWVNCAGCETCPKKSSLGIKLTQYDAKASSTANMVTCDQYLCDVMSPGPYSHCKAGRPCEYRIDYVDGSATAGSLVQDHVHLHQVSTSLEATSISGPIAFGCSSKQIGQLGTTYVAVDGILGFGRGESSFISQLAAQGKVKKIFSHCLSGGHGGGILAIGQVVEPKFNSTPLVPHQPHYNVILESIEVGGVIVDIPPYYLDRSGRGTIIDSGTTAAYLPDRIYGPFMDNLMEKQKGLKMYADGIFKCFSYRGIVDERFPNVTFQFEGSLKLTVRPNDYLIQFRKGHWCIGWHETGGPAGDGKDLIMLGDITLSDKLVVYDLESQTIGWTEHDCTKGIKVKDERTGKIYTVGAHNISPWSDSTIKTVNIVLFVTVICVLYGVFNTMQ